MNTRAARALAGLIAASSTLIALAQQPAPAPPAFAPSNLTPAGVRDMAANCAACHGTHGRPAQGSTAPKLTGRASSEVIQIMGQFREGKKPATLMHQISKGYTPEETAAIADYFAKQQP